MTKLRIDIKASFSHFIKSTAVLLLTWVVVFIGCYEMEPGVSSEEDAGPETTADADADADTDADADADTGEDIDTSTGTGPETDTGTDVDTDVDTDADIDTDIDIDIDIDTDSDIDADCSAQDIAAGYDPNYTYPATCIGDICSRDAPCCKGAICGEGAVVPNASNKTHYCYPLLRKGVLPNAKSECECGDAPAVFFPNGTSGRKWTACLGQGDLTTRRDNVKTFSKEYMYGREELGQEHIQMTSKFKGSLDGRKVPITLLYAYYDFVDFEGNDCVADTEVVRIVGQGNTGMTSIWIWQVMVPVSDWKAGNEITGPYDVDETGVQRHKFASVLMSGKIGGMEIDQIWVEAVAKFGTITVHDPGEPCDDPYACTVASFSVDLQYGALRIEKDLDIDDACGLP